MSEVYTDYTVEVYKRDKRTKKGSRMVKKIDHTSVNLTGITNLYKEVYPGAEGYNIFVFETYVTRRNAMTGSEFKERYDTPYYCSPSSETYWST
jgi:hypothetical protein